MPKSGLDTLLFQGSAAHGFEHVSNGPAHRVEDDRLPDSAQSNDVRVASKEPSTSKTLTKRGIIQDITGGRPIISEEHQIRLSSPTSSSCWETSVDGGPSSLDGTLCVDDEECRDHGDKEVLHPVLSLNITMYEVVPQLLSVGYVACTSRHAMCIT